MLDALKRYELQTHVSKLVAGGVPESTIKEYLVKYKQKNDIFSPSEITATTAPADATVTTPPSDKPDVIFPRVSKQMANKDANNLNIINAGLSDVLSLPGRVAASIPNAFRGNESVAEGMRDTQGKTTFGNIVRNPATSAAIAAAIPTFGASLPALAGSIGVSSLAGATAQQMDNVGQDKELSGTQFSTDLGFGILGGGLGAGAGKLISTGIKKAAEKATPIVIRLSANKLFNEIKPSGKTSQSGFKKDILVKHEIIGDPKDALNKANKIIENNTDELNNAIESSKYILREDKPLLVDAKKVISDLSSSNEITKGFSVEQKEALNEVLSRVSEISPDGQIALTDIPKVKNIIAKMRGDFNKPPSDAADKILGNLYKKIDDAFINKVSNDVSGFKKTVKFRRLLDISKIRGREKQLENVLDKLQRNADVVKQANKNMSEVIPIRNAIEKKIEQGFYDKQPGLLSKAVSKVANVPNLGAELLLQSVAPGASSAARVIGLGSEYSPSLAKTLIKRRDFNALKDVITNRTKLNEMLKSPNLDEYMSLPLYTRRMGDITSGVVEDPAYTRLQIKKIIDELSNVKEVRAKSGKLRTNRMSTFGTIGGKEIIKD